MSLSKVVNNLVRAAASIPADISDSELDAHVAKLLAEEAKEKEARWSELGLGSLLGREATSRESPDPNAPRPSKRFLASVIRNVDGHNTALLREQARAAQAKEGEMGETSKRPKSEARGNRLFGSALRGMGGAGSSSSSRRRSRSPEVETDRMRKERERYRSFKDKEQEKRKGNERKLYGFSDDEDPSLTRNGARRQASLHEEDEEYFINSGYPDVLSSSTRLAHGKGDHDRHGDRETRGPRKDAKASSSKHRDHSSSRDGDRHERGEKHDTRRDTTSSSKHRHQSPSRDGENSRDSDRGRDYRSNRETRVKRVDEETDNKRRDGESSYRSERRRSRSRDHRESSRNRGSKSDQRDHDRRVEKTPRDGSSRHTRYDEDRGEDRYDEHRENRRERRRKEREARERQEGKERVEQAEDSRKGKGREREAPSVKNTDDDKNRAREDHRDGQSSPRRQSPRRHRAQIEQDYQARKARNERNDNDTSTRNDKYLDRGEKNNRDISRTDSDEGYRGYGERETSRNGDKHNYDNHNKYHKSISKSHLTLPTSKHSPPHDDTPAPPTSSPPPPPPPPCAPPSPPPPLPRAEPISKMDKYFERQYDPRLDLGEVPAEGLIQAVGWDGMLEVLKERGKKKRRASSHSPPPGPPSPGPASAKRSSSTLRALEKENERDRVREMERAERKAERAARRARAGEDDEEEERERARRREKRKKEKEKLALLGAASKVGAVGAEGEGYVYVPKGGIREWDLGK